MKKSILLLAAALPFALSAKDVKITRPAASLDAEYPAIPKASAA